MIKLLPRQKRWLAIVVATNLALWLIPSDVVEQIARDRHTLLGRYSRAHFTWIVMIAMGSVVSFYIDWSRGRTYRRRWFQVVATLLVLTPCLAFFDFFLRSPQSAHFVRDSVVFHRPVNARFHIEFSDRPNAARTYADAPAGYGTVSCTGTTDRNGFRNQRVLDKYDVVVLGDSFAEGSKVSDEHAWPELLAARSGLTVYNLGMSSFDPSLYLASLQEYGLALQPRVVICLLYEGNDFRSAKADRKRRRPSLSRRFKRYVKQSPLLEAFDRCLVETFGPINSRGDVAGIEILDWMPLALPRGSNVKHYAFAPKQIRDLYIRREDFARDRHWLNSRKQLGEMRRLCVEAGCRFVVVFAPTKAHVVLPTVGSDLPADHVHAFMALRYKKELPEPELFLTNLLERIEAKESVVRDWCRRESIPFLSLTGTLRTEAEKGKQVYYTYDQHWTPEGHGSVARAVDEFLVDTLAVARCGAISP